MTDLAAQIREAIEHARTQLRDGDDVMASALLAVLDACAPDALPPNGCGCDGDLKLWIQTVIAEKLGIEAGDD